MLYVVFYVWICLVWTFGFFVFYEDKRENGKSGKYNRKSSKYSKKWRIRNWLCGMRVKGGERGDPNKIQNTLYWRWIILQICTQIILELFIRELENCIENFQFNKGRRGGKCLGK